MKGKQRIGSCNLVHISVLLLENIWGFVNPENKRHLLLANVVCHLPAGMIKKEDAGDCYLNMDTSSEKKRESADPSRLQHKISFGSE